MFRENIFYDGFSVLLVSSESVLCAPIWIGDVGACVGANTVDPAGTGLLGFYPITRVCGVSSYISPQLEPLTMVV